MDTLLTKILEEPSIGLLSLIAMLWLCFWIAYTIGRWTERFSRRSKKINSADEQRKLRCKNRAHIRARLELIYVNTLGERIISPGKNTWDEFFLSGPEVSEDFMCDRLRHQGGRHLNGGR
jgi:hypothetical protein